MALRSSLLLVPIVAMCGCGEEWVAPSVGQGGGGGEGAAGASGCPPGTIEEGDDCLAPGVPSDGCAEGFVHDGSYGCTPVIPEGDCGAGEMVILGETTCQPVASCPTEGFSALPEGPVRYVAAGAAAGGDGSVAAPFSSLQVAVDEAPDGSVVAIAAGSYQESVVVAGKRVHLVGMCPGTPTQPGVVIRGQDAEAAVSFAAGADGSTLRGVTLAGESHGLSVSEATVSAQALWIDHVGGQGVRITHGGSLDLERARIDLVHAGGPVQAIRVHSSALSARSIDVLATIEPLSGPGYEGIVALLESTVKLERSRVQLRGVVNEYAPGAVYVRHGRNDLTGLYVYADVTIQLNPPVFPYMPSVRVERTDAGAGEVALRLRQSVLRGGFPATAVITRGDVVFEQTVVRDAPNTLLARGIECTPSSNDASPPAARVLLARSFLDALTWAGVDAAGCEMIIEGSVVRGTQAVVIPYGISLIIPELDESYAGVRGAVGALVRPRYGLDGKLEVRDSLFLDNDAVAIGNYSANVVIDHSRIEGTRSTEHLDGHLTFGDGLALAVANLLNSTPKSPTATVKDSHIHENGRAGIASFGGRAEVTATRVTCSPLGLHGQVMTVGDVDFDYAYTDGGANVCGCDGQDEVCHVVTDGLMPPPPLLDLP